MLEPGREAPRWNGLAAPGPTLVLVPGLAFTKNGGRLGRGGGYYDRFIANVRLEFQTSGEKPPLFFGFAFASQVLQILPLESHDETLDGMITEKGALIF